MKAAIFSTGQPATKPWLKVKDVPRPKLQANHLVLRVLVLRVLACGVCRTDLHIVEGDLRHSCRS